MVAHCRERSAPHADTSARKLTVVSLCVCVSTREAHAIQESCGK